MGGVCCGKENNLQKTYNFQLVPNPNPNPQKKHKPQKPTSPSNDRYKKTNFNDSHSNNNKCCPYCKEPIGKNFYVKECKDFNDCSIFCCGKKGYNGSFKCGDCNNYIDKGDNFYYCSHCNLGIHLKCKKS